MKRKQTKRQAMTEVVISRITVFLVAVITAELFVYEMFGITVSATQNIGMMIYFTFQSMIVGYFLRRHFESRLYRDSSLERV